MTVLLAAWFLVMSSLGLARCQDYTVSSIDCSYSTSDNILMSAVLTKPRGYSGHPVLADSGEESEDCRISHISGLDYSLQISDLASCGALVRNGFVSVRVWFPQIPGVFTSTDQEVIILCRPPDTSSQPLVRGESQTVKVGQVETEDSEKETLLYEVSLYKESSGVEEGLTEGEGVPIGTLLQVRVSLVPSSPVWRYVSLHQLTLSPSSTDPLAPGHVTLGQGGCRPQEFAGVVPSHPATSPNNSREVRLDFEAVMLDINRSEESKVWVHVTSRACTGLARCEVECGEEEDGKERRVRSIRTESSLPGSLISIRRQNDRDDLVLDLNLDREANFTDNLGLSVSRPGEGFYSPSSISADQETNCTTFLIFGILMGCLLIVASVMMCLLAYRLNSLAVGYKVRLAGLFKQNCREGIGPKVLLEVK